LGCYFFHRLSQLSKKTAERFKACVLVPIHGLGPAAQDEPKEGVMATHDKPAELEDILLREMHHRFYNSLQVISSMASKVLRELAGGPIFGGLEEIQNRISILARFHRLLAEPLVHEGGLGVACEELCANLLHAFDRSDARFTFAIDGHPTSPMQARGMMLLLVELVTNALKHGAVSPDIFVRLEHRDHGSLLIVRSATDQAVRPYRPRIAANLVESMGGTLSVSADDWFEVRIELPQSLPQKLRSDVGDDGIFHGGVNSFEYRASLDRI
jgi:two-component sensor histidine kinase